MCMGVSRVWRAHHTYRGGVEAVDLEVGEASDDVLPQARSGLDALGLALEEVHVHVERRHRRRKRHASPCLCRRLVLSLATGDFRVLVAAAIRTPAGCCWLLLLHPSPWPRGCGRRLLKECRLVEYIICPLLSPPIGH